MSDQKDAYVFDSTKIPVAFSPNDFFYLSVGSDMPKRSFCEENLNNQQDCTDVNASIVDVCYQQELCKNRTLAESIYTNRNNHGESRAKLNDVYSQYTNEYMKTVNLGGGIILAILFIYYGH
jgi:hypothetical protein